MGRRENNSTLKPFSLIHFTVSTYSLGKPSAGLPPTRMLSRNFWCSPTLSSPLLLRTRHPCRGVMRPVLASGLWEEVMCCSFPCLSDPETEVTQEAAWTPSFHTEDSCPGESPGLTADFCCVETVQCGAYLLLQNNLALLTDTHLENHVLVQGVPESLDRSLDSTRPQFPHVCGEARGLFSSY